MEVLVGLIIATLPMAIVVGGGLFIMAYAVLRMIGDIINGRF